MNISDLIMEENGKRYLMTSVEQRKNFVDVNKLFNDLETVRNFDEKNNVKIDRNHPCQKILNRFSGNYMSPTFLKSFMDCPVNQIYNNLMPFVPSDITSIGKTVHSIFQEFYDLEKDDREIDKIWEIEKRLVEENNQFNQKKQIDYYVNGFINTHDYLDFNTPMNHKQLDCSNEFFMKGECSPLGVKLPLPIYCLSDRIDFRDQGIFIIDYKTGTSYDKRITTMNGYLPQMICYKWMVEENFGEKVKGAYLLIPGTKEKIVKLDINGLENQSRYIDKIFYFEKMFKKLAETKIFPEHKMQYCNYCKFKNYCNLFNNKEENSIIEIKYDITLEN